ncbi:MAG: porphobilinogen synthase [Candidatus Sumerlaeota bacterium]|nr:porphobilinogen synthase [Candidatus Sumerlaeota bacterium]
MPYPVERLSRLRANRVLREMLREHAPTGADLIYPMFAVPGTGVRREIRSMPGQFNLSVDELTEHARRAAAAGVRAVILFGVPEKKDGQASGAYAADGIFQQAARALKAALPDLLVIADTCLCEYTDHGHCFIFSGQRPNAEATLAVLAGTAVSQAQAGADMIAPSGMVDGMVQAIRAALDQNGFAHVPIMSYAVKYASSFYGPFRDAVESAPAFGDRAWHQMDPPNAREALREAELDAAEGADILMVKPGLPYLDVLAKMRERFDLPLAAYQVSGEYSMIKAAAAQGWMDENRAILETLTSLKRAGADLILTYFAMDALEKGIVKS